MSEELKPVTRIEQLEALLERENSWDEDQEIEIMPNGEIRAKSPANAADAAPLKPLTFRENLGGEYAQ